MKVLKGLLLMTIIGGYFAACDQTIDHGIKPITEEYYQTYQQRQDFQKFLSFYADTMVLEDVILVNG